MTQEGQQNIQHETTGDQGRLADSVPKNRAGVVKGAGADIPAKYTLNKHIQITETTLGKQHAKQLYTASIRKNPTTRKAEYQLKELSEATGSLYRNGKWYLEKDVRRL
ncbi:hypothetical protein T440DRAFT_534097 [Plenodomus tracheiphilus IPT5]|uniref:Uncharacterized protein n=1 Tax=Plenodomus tracheiphilus IPT5 TaxID=1408161 RepID=A0A6A7B419_9PLEO|nr:hypothetical protein T440DRAFT_534097 [Plenodomus tracheiphilus IPT5]